MLTASQLKNGTIFVYQDEPWRVLTYKHTHMGRGSADVRVKIKGLISDAVLSRNFSPDARFEEASLTKRKMQFLYKEGKTLFFMDPATFEQIELSADIIGGGANFLIDGEVFPVVFWDCPKSDSLAIDIELPPSVVLEVVDCPPGVRGNTVSNVYKAATLSNGAIVKIPLFIEKGGRVRVDTRTGDYIERAR